MLKDDSDHVPVTYDHCDHISGPFLHGTKSVLAPGEDLTTGFVSNFQDGRTLKHIYFTTLESTAAWGAQLSAALGGLDERGHIYVVEPLGPFEDDPNVTDKKFPGNPTESYRTDAALRVVRELTEWEAHPAETVQGMLAGLEQLRAAGKDVIFD